MKIKNKVLFTLVFLFLPVLVFLFIILSPDYNRKKVIEIKETEKGGYQLLIDKKPFFIKGVIYNPTPIGEGPGYNFFTHKPKPWQVADGKLMKKMGINAVRIYTAGDDLEATAEFIQDMYKKYQIYTAVSDWLGLWDPHANYADPQFRKEKKEEVLKVVRALKDEPGVLMWILGNEHNYTFSGKVRFWTSPEIEKIERPYQRQLKRAEIFYSFVDDVAAAIKEIDPSRPVALSNGEVSYLGAAAKVCQNIDALAIIAYRGKVFGNMFERIRDTFDKPIFLSEFGCDSYHALEKKEDQEIQAEFLLSQWKDIYENSAKSSNPEGNVLGGFIFEWTDEWWKYRQNNPETWSVHNTQASWSEGSYYHDVEAEDNLNMNEEWFGIVSISKEPEDNINKRTPKKAYYKLKDFFQKIK